MVEGPGRVLLDEGSSRPQVEWLDEGACVIWRIFFGIRTYSHAAVAIWLERILLLKSIPKYSEQ